MGARPPLSQCPEHGTQDGHSPLSEHRGVPPAAARMQVPTPLSPLPEFRSQGQLRGQLKDAGPSASATTAAQEPLPPELGTVLVRTQAQWRLPRPWLWTPEAKAGVSDGQFHLLPPRDPLCIPACPPETDLVEVAEHLEGGGRF